MDGWIAPYLELGGNLFTLVNLILIIHIVNKLSKQDKVINHILTELEVHETKAEYTSRQVDRMEKKVFNES